MRKTPILLSFLLMLLLLPAAGRSETIDSQRIEVERVRVMEESERPWYRRPGTENLPEPIPSSAYQPPAPVYQQVPAAQPAPAPQPAATYQPVIEPAPAATYPAPAASPTAYEPPPPFYQRQGAQPAPTAAYQPAPAPQRWQAIEPSQHAFSPAEYFYDRYGLFFDYGGWYYLNYTDRTESNHSSVYGDSVGYTLDHDLRLWGKLVAPSGNMGYLRLKATATHVEQDKPDYRGLGSDFAGPFVDLAYLEHQLPVPNFWRHASNARFKAIAGRQFIQVGRGTVLGGREDGLRFAYTGGEWSWKAFAAREVPGTNNIDWTVPGGGRAAHNFFGFELNCHLFADQKFSGYVLRVKDSSREYPIDDYQEYDYDPVYWGLGAEGQAAPNLRYWAEYTYENGSGYVDNTESQRARIHARALDLGLQYFFAKLTGNPSLAVQYLEGSGDGERGLVPGTNGGVNPLLGTTDHAFQYFGYVPLGYAWQPQLTNLEVLKFSASIQPLRYFDLENESILTLAYFDFKRSRPDGVTSDFMAVPIDTVSPLLGANPYGGTTPQTERGRDLGNEYDLGFTWKVCSDVQVTTTYGLFRPGQAFPEGHRLKSQYFALGSIVKF